jgi:hypothetical protein
MKPTEFKKIAKRNPSIEWSQTTEKEVKTELQSC